MSTTTWFLVLLAYAGMAHAVWVPPSAWVAADREKTGWVVVLAIPVINVLGLVAYVIGVLPVLLGPTGDARSNSFRRGGPGGPATRTAHDPARHTGRPAGAAIPGTWSAHSVPAAPAGRTLMAAPPALPTPGATTPAPTAPAAIQGHVTDSPAQAGAADQTLVTDPAEPPTGPIQLVVPQTRRAAVSPPFPRFTAPPGHAPAPTAAALPYTRPTSAVSGAVARQPGPHPTWSPQPPPPARTVTRSDWSAPAVAVLAVAAMIIAGGLTWYLLPGKTPTSAVVAVSPAAPAAVGEVSPAQTLDAGSSATSAPTLDAKTQLIALTGEDRALVESVVGQWVPQVGAKQAGTVDNGITYDDDTILSDVVTAKQRYPGAALLRSDDYTSFRRGGFWVMVVAIPFSTAAEANAWCETYGLAAKDCFAKRLSHTEGPQGNTLPR